MSYEVLARKLRPSGFEALVGQEHVVKALANALDSERLHHAYLFTGTRGVGKTTVARILAKCLNCEQGVGSTPCGECSACTEIKENRFIDLIEVDAASRTGVDDTRDLLENAQYLPTRGRYKVYLIDEVHMLSAASFNALLKTLEEPPEHVKFLLATTDPKKVPVTVLSRCLQFQLKNLSRDVIADYLNQVLEEEGIEHDSEALAVIAKNAAGSMRDALSLTDQAIAYGDGAVHTDDVVSMLGIVGRDEVGAIVDALRQGSAQSLMDLSAALAERNADFVDVLSGVIERLHELSVDTALGRNESSFSPDELQLFYQIALLGYRDIHIVPEERSGFEMTLLRMLAFAPGDSNVARLEPDVTTAKDQEPPAQSPAPEAMASSSNGVPNASQVAGSAVEAPPIARGVQGSENQSDWYGIVANLKVGGVARMIAEHSVAVEIAPPNVRLVLDEKHDTLLSEAQEKALCRSLGDAMGQEIRLTVDVGVPEQETPAQRNARLTEERQEAAEAAIAGDATVKGLLAEFGGRLDEVRPR
jgi:DNA polymerase-3 subunit gamma/tau